MCVPGAFSLKLFYAQKLVYYFFLNFVISRMCSLNTKIKPYREGSRRYEECETPITEYSHTHVSGIYQKLCAVSVRNSFVTATKAPKYNNSNIFLAWVFGKISPQISTNNKHTQNLRGFMVITIIWRKEPLIQIKTKN